MIQRCIAAAQVLLVLPATLFMASLFVQHLEPVPPAQSARRLVGWFSTHVVLGLYVFLAALPLAALLIGCTTMVIRWRNDEAFRQAALDALAAVREHLATLLIAGLTAVAGGILAIVAMHVITN
jgi:ABC-type Fe3+ transport system permease subunit